MSLKTRSRAGCLSCKRLRIKCDERKPVCEYCIHTNRECKYLQQVNVYRPRRKRGKSVTGDDRASGLVENSYKHDDKCISTKTCRLNMNQLLFDLVLNQSTMHLSISKFELRLLNFFNFYGVSLFSFGKNREVAAVWANDVPPLFLQSHLVKISILMYSCVISLPSNYCVNDTSLTSQRMHQINKLNFTDTDICKLKMLFNNYLQQLIHLLSCVVGENSSPTNIASNPRVFSPFVAKEITLASIVLFIVLSMSDSIVKLVSFEPGETDLLSITKGIQHFRDMANVPLSGSDFVRIHHMKEDNLPKTMMLSSKIPIINHLLHDLQTMYQLSESTSPESIVEFQILNAAIERLQQQFYKAIKFQYPVPLFRYLLVVDDRLFDLVHAKNYLGLRIIFVVSCLELICQFMVLEESNIWHDYIHFYRHYTFQINNQCWKYPMDEALFNITLVNKFKVVDSDYSIFTTFDPLNWPNHSPIT